MTGSGCNYTNGQTPKKTPVRTCCACGEREPKANFVRFVRTAAGDVELDKSGKAAGRGTYVCKNRECFANASKHHRFEKTLKMPVGKEEYIKLQQDFEMLLQDPNLQKGAVE